MTTKRQLGGGGQDGTMGDREGGQGRLSGREGKSTTIIHVFLTICICISVDVGLHNTFLLQFSYCITRDSEAKRKTASQNIHAYIYIYTYMHAGQRRKG